MFKIDEEFRTLIPPLSDEEKEQLTANILADGIREPLSVWNGILLDGHNRYEIAMEHGLPFEIKEYDFDSREEALQWVIKNQLGRRNISTVDRVLLAQKQTELLAEQAKVNQRLGGQLKGDIRNEEAFDNVVKSSQKEFAPINVRKETSRIAGVSEGTIGKVLKIQKEQPQLLERIRNGEMSIDRAHKYAFPHTAYLSAETEWYTQPFIVEMAREVMGSVDCDPASHEIPQRWIQAETYYTVETNGLNHKWEGNIWLNPPFASGVLPKFIDKFLEELHAGNIRQAIILTNNATETKWCSEIIKEASCICFPHGRLGFIKSPGETPQPPMQGQIVTYFGKRVDDFARIFGEIGEIVVPYKD